MKKKTAKELILPIFLLIWLSFAGTIQSSAQTPETVTFRLTDRAGTGFGTYIEGKFTLVAEGSEGIIRMAVYFNNDLVYNVTGNQISWRFEYRE